MRYQCHVKSHVLVLVIYIIKYKISKRMTMNIMERVDYELKLSCLVSSVLKVSCLNQFIVESRMMKGLCAGKKDRLFWFESDVSYNVKRIRFAKWSTRVNIKLIEKGFNLLRVCILIRWFNIYWLNE